MGGRPHRGHWLVTITTFIKPTPYIVQAMNLREACSAIGVQEDELGHKVKLPRVKQIFRKLVLEHHPDKNVNVKKNVDADLFINIKSAYDYILKYLSEQFVDDKENLDVNNDQTPQAPPTSENPKESKSDAAPKKQNSEQTYESPPTEPCADEGCPMDVDPPFDDFSYEIPQSNKSDRKDKASDVKSEHEIKKTELVKIPRIHKPCQIRAILFAILQIIGSRYHQLFTSAQIFEHLKSKDLILMHKKGDKLIPKTNEFMITETTDNLIKNRIQSRMNEYPAYFCKAVKGHFSLSQSARDAAIAEFNL